MREVEQFFDKWTPTMAYVLGYFAADGSMYKNPRGSCYISFTSADQDLVVTIKSLLKTSNVIEKYQPKNSNWKPRYTLQIGSKKIFSKLVDLGFTPNKSLSLRYPVKIPVKFLGHFVRGYFDGDGTIEFGYFKRKQRGYRLSKRFSFRLTSGCKLFLEHLSQKIFETTYISSGKVFLGRRAFVLAYSRKDMLKLYNFIYPTNNLPCLERKRSKFSEGVKDLGL